MKVWELEKRYLGLAEDLPCAVFDLDRRGNFVYINREARSLLGQREELLGKKFAEKVSKRHLYELLKLFRGAIKTGKKKGRINLEAGEQYSQVDLEVRAVRVKGDIIGFQCLAQRRWERANLLAALIYELATALTIAKGALELAIGGKDSHKFLKMGRNALIRQGRIIRNLFDALRFEELESELILREVNLREILASAAREFEPLAAKKGTSITLIAEEIPAVKADPEKIKNAVYTLIDIAVKGCKGREIRITARRAGGGVEVCFPRARSPCEAGLTIARRIVEAHNGAARFEKERLCFFLPG
jgi:PAS domain S-box-containing protein